jgi:hypothetical protein
MLALSSCADFQSGVPNSSDGYQGRPIGITPGMEGGIGALLAGTGAIISNNGGRDLGNMLMFGGGLLALHAAYRYSADAHQEQLAQSRAGGRSGSYYVKVPPKKGYSGPSGTHLVPYKNGAVAGRVKVVPENPSAGRTITVDGTQGTVL